MKRFAIIGAAGYIAPRHMKAIKENKGVLVAALDPNDSVGILDRYFPEAYFFTELERFDRYLERISREGKGIDYLVVCSPNYLHDSHIRFGLKHKADVICEKPIVLNPWNLDSIKALEQISERKVYCIQQLRLHSEYQRLKEYLAANNSSSILQAELTYITPRGNWYYTSWKGQEEKSGGLVSNIGVHLFDMLIELFGSKADIRIDLREHDRIAGAIEFPGVNVNWFLSVSGDIAETAKKEQWATRVFKFNDQVFNFSSGFENLHDQSYKSILAGNGFGIKDIEDSISLISKIRSEQISKEGKGKHPLVNAPRLPHPFNRT